MKTWDRMDAKLKDKFFPIDYMISLFRKVQNLRQKELTVKEFIEEFYRLSIRSGQTDEGEEEVTRYVNGLKYSIQDELSLSRFRTVGESYQLTLKAEEKLARKTSTSRGNKMLEVKCIPIPKDKPARQRKKKVGTIDKRKA